LKRDEVNKEEFLEIWDRVINSRAGEPGVYWTNDKDWGTNPCVEIGLRPYQFCNLTETNVSDVATQEDLEGRVKAGAFSGTLQAAYTDFHYLRPIWQDTTEKDALIGVSMTGIGSGSILGLDLTKAANIVVEENKRVSKILGINQAARTTAVKPAGTTSLVVGSSSGIHAWHAPYYVRRMRVGKNEALYSYMKEHLPALVEDCYFKPHLEAVMSFPQKAPEGSIFRTEKPLDLLERVKKFNKEWVAPGHNDGVNNHNVSCTISLKDDEWWACADWMWANRYVYNGISVLPFDGGTYIQAPFTDSTEEEYTKMEHLLQSIDLTKVMEKSDETHLTDQAACAGGTCEVS
jgi:ribonucleoside-diphosphate reductase alpha chain